MAIDLDDPMPSMGHETLPELPPHEASTNSELPVQSRPENASLNSASATPLPPSSPANASQLTPRLRMDVSTPQAQSPVPRPPTSRPLNPYRRSSTPLQSIRRAPSTPYIDGPNTPSRPAISRRTSSNHLTPSSASTTHSRASSGATIKDVERKPAITAASVAQEHFRKELVAHDSAETSSKTVVIIPDSCYGHRYSRPRTSKAALNTIVERPERLHACILGASTAYVRIGGRHAGGSHPPHPDQDVPPPPFKIRKTTRSTPLNFSAVTQVHGQKWMEELQIMCDSAEGKLAMNGRELVRPIGYGKDEGGNPLPKLHEGDLYLCSESLDALQGCLGGVCEAVDTVFASGNTSRAFVCIRPPGHHCSSNFPSGFCWLNNVHVGIAHAAMTQGLTHAAIIDFDLHHGDGSQAIAWDHNRKAAGNLPKTASSYSKTPIGYFSLHDINSYPCEWGDEEKIKNASLCLENAHGQSIWNVHLESWKNHADFWKLYESRYSVLLEKTRIFLRHHTTRLQSANNGAKAKAAIFLSAGFDASEWEGAGMQRHEVNVPTDFYARFTSDVATLADEVGLGVDGRIISVLEGGYSDRALTSGVLSHLCGLTADSGHANANSETVDQSLASAMAKQLGMLNPNCHTNHINGEKSAVGGDPATEINYNPEWWTTLHLEALETLTNPAPAPSLQAKLKDKPSGNYSSPTQASTAKMADPARERRSVSGQADGRASMEPEPVQPLPDVDWDVASYELSRLLIPRDRQTLSCKHDELNAEATKVRRERQSGIGLPSNDLSATDQKMQLRDRKVKAPVPEELTKGVSKSDRRRTIAAVGDLPDPGALRHGGNRPAVGIANTRPRRRSSAGSSILSAFESMNLTDSGSQPSETGMVPGRGELVPNHEQARISTAKADKAPVHRKVRQPTAAKAQPIKAKTSPRKAGPALPVAKGPSAFRRSSSYASIQEREVTIDQAQSAPKTTVSANSVTIDDLDTLSSGMKKMKIHLKVPSPEEIAARQRKTTEESDKQKRARAPRKPAVPKTGKVALTKDQNRSNMAGAIPSSTSEISTTDQNAPPLDIIPPIVQLEKLPESVQKEELSASVTDYVPTADTAHAEPPLQATFPAPVPAPMEMESIPSVDRAVEHLPRTSERQPSNEMQPSTDNTEAIPPSVPSSLPHPEQTDPSHPSVSREAPASVSAPVTAKKTRACLPQFTASSPIPFAKIDANLSPQSAKEEKEDSGPNATSSGRRSRDVATPEIHQRTTPRENKPPTEPLRSKPVHLDQASIWDVPETPQQ